MTPRRVVFVTTSYPRRAGDFAGHFVETEARQRARCGDHVVVLAPGDGVGAWPETAGSRRGGPDAGEPRLEWLPGGAAFGAPGAVERLRRAPWRIASAARFVAAARRRVRELSPDEIVAHWVVPSAWPVALAAERASVEVVAHGSDVRLVERLPRPARVAIARALIERGATFRFVAETLRTRFAEATLDAVLLQSRVEPSPIDVSAAPGRAASRARLGVEETARLAVVVGRLVASKRPEAAVSAALARADRVVVVGDGPLSRRVAALGPRVELAGAVSRDLALAWIAAADVLVSASRDEGAPTAIREARALGVPVLAAPCGDLSAWAAADAGITLLEES